MPSKAIVEKDVKAGTTERSIGYYVRSGAIAGLLAGAVFAVFEMIVAAAMGMGIGGPWKMFASVLLGKSAMAQLTFGVFIVGFIVHFALAALFGAAWGAIAKKVPTSIRYGVGGHTAAAMLYGLAIYLINFQIIARLAYPWFLGANQGAQIVLHVLAFGLPLGLFLVSRLRAMGAVGAGRRRVIA